MLRAQQQKWVVLRERHVRFAAGTLGAMHRLVAFHAALQRGIYSNMSMAELSAALGDRPGVEHGIFAEGLLEMHLRRAGLHVRTTGFDKKQLENWRSAVS